MIDRVSFDDALDATDRRCKEFLNKSRSEFASEVGAQRLENHPMVAHLILSLKWTSHPSEGRDTGQPTVEAYAESLQRLLSVTSDTPLVALELAPDGSKIMLEPSGLVIELMGAGEKLYFTFRESLHQSSGSVRVNGYAYSIFTDPQLNEELIAWHDHPKSRVGPHMHIGRHYDGVGWLKRMHIPSGEVSLVQVLAFLIAEFRVMPRGSLKELPELAQLLDVRGLVR